jgi:mannose-1-phosphate guanylyltransferase
MRYSNSKKQFFPKGVNYSSLPNDLIDVTREEHDAALNRQPGETLDFVDGHVVVVPVSESTLAANAWAMLQSNAKSALDKSDITILRCAENNIPVPANWAAYRAELRAIISAQSGDANQVLPVRPAYPEGS